MLFTSAHASMVENVNHTGEIILDKKDRMLFIHETMDHLKKFWIQNSGSDFSDIMLQIMEEENFNFTDGEFSDKLIFELEQMDD
jgi:hypothetical protein